MSTVATTAAILPSFAFFCALPYLPLTYTLAILSIIYYRSFRLGSRARRQARSSVRRSSGSSRQAKNIGELLQAGKKSSINTPYSNRNAKPPLLGQSQCSVMLVVPWLCHHRLARSFDSLTSSIPSYQQLHLRSETEILFMKVLCCRILDQKLKSCS